MMEKEKKKRKKENEGFFFPEEAFLLRAEATIGGVAREDNEGFFFSFEKRPCCVPEEAALGGVAQQDNGSFSSPLFYPGKKTSLRARRGGNIR